jgi:tetratricopeptide (TPR) repeat protein/predicted aspartyl protease
MARSGWVRHRLAVLVAGVFMAIAVTPAAHAACSLGTVTLPVTMEGLRASVPVRINGKPTSLWLDSGAWFSTMSQARATDLGLPLHDAPQGFYMTGIGGSFTPQVAKIKLFGLLDSELHDVDFLVGGSDPGNGLIGRNIIAQDDTEFDLAHGTVKLIRPKDCGKSVMTYWAPGQPYFVAHMVPDERGERIPSFKIRVRINQADIVAEVDSGAAITLITRRAAQRAGLDLNGPTATPIQGISGFGRRSFRGWAVPVAKVAIGEEEVLHSHINVMDGEIGNSPNAPDMLLGADFLLAHHVYFARDRNLMFFTYGGGKPFLSEADSRGAPTSESATPAATPLPDGRQRAQAVDNAEMPQSADDFARRAAARASRADFAGAIADLTEAITREPNHADWYERRATAYAQEGKGKLAVADFDHALELAPKNSDLLLNRAHRRLHGGDRDGALADVEAAAAVVDPHSYDALHVASLYVTLGHAERAIPLYDAVIATHGDDHSLATLLNDGCWARAVANTDLVKALALCNRALKLAHDRPTMLDSRGLVHFRQHDYAGALADYDAAIAAEAKSPWSLYMRGLTKAAMGQKEAAEADRQAALAIDPKLPEMARTYHVE